MMSKVTQHLVPAALAALVVFSLIPFVESVNRLYQYTVPAVEWHGVRVETPLVRHGDTLTIVYNATVNKQCPSDIRGFLVRSDNSVPVRFPIVSGGYTKPSDEPTDIRVNIRIPSDSDPGLQNLTPGNYVYRTLVTRFCPDGFEEDVHVPDAPFTLIN